MAGSRPRAASAPIPGGRPTSTWPHPRTPYRLALAETTAPPARRVPSATANRPAHGRAHRGHSDPDAPGDGLARISLLSLRHPLIPAHARPCAQFPVLAAQWKDQTHLAQQTLPHPLSRRHACAAPAAPPLPANHTACVQVTTYCNETPNRPNLIAKLLFCARGGGVFADLGRDVAPFTAACLWPCGCRT